MSGMHLVVCFRLLLLCGSMMKIQRVCAVYFTFFNVKVVLSVRKGCTVPSVYTLTVFTINLE